VRVAVTVILGSSAAVFLQGGCASSVRDEAPIILNVAALEAQSGVGPTIAPTTVEAVGETVVQTHTEEVGTDHLSRVASTRIIETNGEIVGVQETTAVRIAVGERYTIDGLIGQINGRPLYVDEFLAPIAARLMRLAVDPETTRASKAGAIAERVSKRFDDYVNDELVIAEAESKLNPEAQMGVFGWLASVREETIAMRGGTRAMAEASIAEEFDMTLDEFMEARRSIALATSLLQKRVEPRAIVSWRDVEQEYQRRYAEFNPRATIKLGRLRFHKERDAEMIEAVRIRVEAGADFALLVSEFDVEDDGAWLEFELPKEGIDGLSVAGSIKERLASLSHGEVSEPLDQTAFVSWFTITEIVEPKRTSLYDTAVQIQLENQLRDQRRRQERIRYITSLRSRWVSDDIAIMKARLIRLARNRYLGD
jgi:hypothetical protein